jgi:predicted Ser/Thr protein kinase
MTSDPLGGIIAGRYELLSEAGKGGMARVYRARDLDTSRTVAVKILIDDRPFDVARFEREAAVLATVHHPNVVTYLAHGTHDGVHFLVQEWVDGDTLAAHLRRTGATARDAVSLGLGLSTALEAIHGMGVVHRDLKPSNIILVGGQAHVVKLVDFGIARAANQTGNLTLTGMMLGTPSYMSPEHAQGLARIGAATDVWALGCVLYEVLTGRVAFAGKTSAAIRAKVMIDEPAAIESLCPEAPGTLVELVRAMLGKESDDRPKARDVSDRLRAIIEQGGALADGPRRRSGVDEAATIAMAAPRPTGITSYVFVSSPEAPASNALTAVAATNAMRVHAFDDGTALMVSERPGIPGALAAVRAASALHAEGFGGVISVFGRAASDTLGQALDRGSALLDRALMRTLFGRDDGPAVFVDGVIAAAIADELPIEHTEDGAVVRMGSRGQTSRG